MKLRTYRTLAVFISINILFEIIAPSIAFALTGGPSQPEVSGFQPIGASDMVDVKTGDFSYNIPLMDVGGYPVNLAYSAGSTMDDEASWVGLGWSLNPGIMSRSMKGLPDDHKGDVVTKKMHIKPDITTSIQLSKPVLGEILGIEFKGERTYELSYNNYRGADFALGYSLSTTFDLGKGAGITAGLGFSGSQKNGLDLKPSVGLSYQTDRHKKSNYDLNAKFGLPFNSRQGVKQLTIQGSIEQSKVERIMGNSSQKRNVEIGKEGGSGSGSVGSAWTFARTAIAPSVDMPRNFKSFSAFVEIGTTKTILYRPKFGVTVSYAESRLASNSKSNGAYGSLYSHRASKTSLMDFNREKDNAVGPNSVALGMALAGQDGFNAQGQGVSGSYKVYARNLGTFYDPYLAHSSSRTFGGGVELGIPASGPIIDGHIGVDIQYAYVNSHQGKWNHNRLGELDFDTEPFIGPTGENVPVNHLSGFNETNRLSPTSFEIIRNTRGATLTGLLTSGNGNFEGDIKRSERIRNNVLTYFTAEEAAKYSTPQINSYAVNTELAPRNNALQPPIDRVGGRRQKHHLSEMTVTRTDGARYTYGIPAYNNFQKEATFSISGESEPNYSTGLVNYNTGRDPDPDQNKNGQEEFVEIVETPGYAHSFLLTSIVSSDYIDRTGNGNTYDDFGSYTKFNYSRIHSDYKWRVPVEGGKATHSEGLKSIQYNEKRSDDKANYIYGEKEIWMMHSIETKTHTAYFILDETRGDGKGVNDEHGGRSDAMNLYSLKRIDLYTKEELKKDEPVPIKSIHFVYTKDISGMNDLCPGVSNSTSPTGGKLTLAEVYFTYGTSYKGKFSSYKFTYTSNYPYNIKSYDRWGNYKPNPPNVHYDPSDKVLTTAEFPYTEQNNKTEVDKYAAAWCLSRIELPSGGVINVEYESDDYAYVQNEKAMQMYVLDGAYWDTNKSTLSGANKNTLMLGDDNHSYLFFNLEHTITGSNKREDFRKQYLDGVNLVYFKCLVNIGSSDAKQYEYVSGYAPVDEYDVTSDGTQAWIKLKHKGIKTNEEANSVDKVNPITKAGWQFTRMHRPEIAWGMAGSDADQTKLIDFAGFLLGSINSLIETFRGVNRSMRHKGLSFEFVPHKSMIRLNTPDGHKLGGGHRVKKISISDNWSALSGGNETATYGQVYDYTLSDNDDNAANNISSGVASYEPLLGGEENPLRKPIYISENNLLVPDNNYYMEGPFGEGYYPSPQVIYSEVKVSSLNNTYKSSNTGYVVNTFYTTKDFPTISKKTGITPIESPKSLVFRTFFRSTDIRSYTQGFSVEVNNIAGQPKSTFVYDRNGNQLSGVTYHYKQEQRRENVVVKRNGKIIVSPVYKTALSNNLNVLRKNSTNGSYLGTSELGLEIESFSDSREYSNEGRSMKGHFNIDPVFLPFGFFIGILPLIPFDREDTKVRIVTHVKIIYRNPILEKVVAYEDGSSVETQNLLYDETTGDVLLTKTTNQFGDNVYNFTYPAHFGYDRMGHAYKNQGYRFSDVNFSNLNSAQKANFVVGDELRLQAWNPATSTWSSTISRAWVSGNKTTGVLVVNEANVEVVGIYRGVVFRSGRKNMQSTPMGSVTTLSDPRIDTNSDGIPDAISFSKVLNAGAIEFSENWKTYCECDMSTGQQIDFTQFNPYLYSDKGNWRVNKSYAYLTERTQKIQNDNTDIRHDGEFKQFNPFWVPASTGDWTKNTTNWQYVTEVTNYSPMGYELENRDALGRFSSATYGYNALLPVAVHNNSKYEQSTAEGFEDYKMSSPCALGKKLSYMSHTSKISDAESHTGRYSIKVSPNGTVKAYNIIDYCEEE